MRASVVMREFLVPGSAIVAPSAYQEVLANYRYPDHVRHFPKVNPPDASNIEFRYFEGFVDGPSIKLRFTTTPEEVRRVQKLCAGADDIKEMDKTPLGWNYGSARQTSYRFFEFQSPGNEEYKSETYGIGIDTERNEIYYWAFSR